MIRPNVVAKNDVHAGFGMPTNMVPEALPSDIRLSEAPPPDRTSNPPLETTTVLTPSCEPLGTPARLTSGARLIHSPPFWVDGTPSTALPSGAYKHDLQDALVQASCRSNTWEELAPPILGRHPFRSSVN